MGGGGRQIMKIAAGVGAGHCRLSWLCSSSNLLCRSSDVGCKDSSKSIGSSRASRSGRAPTPARDVHHPRLQHVIFGHHAAVKPGLYLQVRQWVGRPKVGRQGCAWPSCCQQALSEAAGQAGNMAVAVGQAVRGPGAKLPVGQARGRADPARGIWVSGKLAMRLTGGGAGTVDG